MATDVESPASSPATSSRRFWPFGARWAVVIAPVLLIAFLIGWRVNNDALKIDQAATGWILLGIAVLSVVPIALVVLDGLALGGGTVEVGAVKVALNAVANQQHLVIIPRNATQDPGLPITDSGSHQILSSLEQARKSEIVVVDLEDGTAWWETRLLILSEGAVRLGRPRVIVFTAQEEEKSGRFIGWASPREIRDLLLARDGGYREAFDRAMGLASAARLQIADPAQPNAGTLQSNNQLLQQKQLIIHQQIDGMVSAALNPFLEEQLLADALGPIEISRRQEITVHRLRDVFGSVLHTTSIDSTKGTDWFQSALGNDDPYIAVTTSGRYTALMTRVALTNIILSALTEVGGTSR